MVRDPLPETGIITCSKVPWPMLTPVSMAIWALVLPAGRLIRPPEPELTFQSALSAVAVLSSSVLWPHQNLWLALFAAMAMLFALTLVLLPMLALTVLCTKWLGVAPLAPATAA